VQSGSCGIVCILTLLSSLEEDCGELTAQASLPQTCVLRRHQVDLVDKKKYFLSCLDSLVLNLLGAAALWISGVQNLNHDVGGFDDLFEFFVKSASTLSHFTILSIDFS